VSAEFVGCDGTLVEGARAVAPCTAVAVSPGGVEERCWWPPSERWSAIPEPDAQAAAEAALAAAVARRVSSEPSAYLGLTAGLDSPVVAIAMLEAGIEFRAFTWGNPEWDDARGAVDVAEALGVEHRIQRSRWRSDEEVLARAAAATRWNEGSRVEFAEPTVPEDMSAFVTGSGGEAGRTFYYREQAAALPEADSEHALAVLRRQLAFRLPGADPEARASLERAVGDWIGAARAAGLEGWRCLDHVYVEQRLRRWGRHMLVCGPAPMVPPLAATAVTRAVVSLPLEARRSDQFHRTFLATRRPDLLPARPAPPRSSPLRRAASRARAVFQPAAAAPADGGPPPLPGKWEWDDRPSLRAWVLDDVLRSPLLAEGLGEGWLEAMRARFAARDGWAEEVAQWAAGPVALAAALAELEALGRADGA
jgi:hypothetical protein